MNKIRNKMKKQGGFTLIEMLLVVAIIAILVAVSIPVVNNALERTRQATDAANERAAKAAVMVAYLSEAKISGEDKFDSSKIYAYDAVSGKLLTTVPDSKYGKCTEKGHKDMYIIVKYDVKENEVVLGWTNITDHLPSADSTLNSAAENVHGVTEVTDGTE